MTRLLNRLFVPACAALAVLVGSTADAAFSASTAVRSAGGTSVTTGSIGAVTVAGATVTFNDYATTGNTTGAIPAEAYTLTGMYTGPTAGTAFSVTELITVINTSANGTMTTGTFTEVANFTLNSVGLITNGTPTVTPTTQTLGDTTFTIISMSSSSAQFGQATNNGAISTVIVTSPSAVPEPASIALLGLGLVGVVARRRLARA